MKSILGLTCIYTLIHSLGEVTVWQERRNSSVQLDIPGNNSTPSSKKENYENSGAAFQCSTSKPSSYKRAQSVHYLTPYDVDVIAGIGDSVTAGFGAGAKSSAAFPLDYRGVSWSTGGDKTLSRVTTLPNILRKYNPSLTGYSTGVSFVFPDNLNMAIAGVQSSHLIHQAKSLVEKMDKLFGSRQVVDSKWKVITVMAGFNDICYSCGRNLQDHVNTYLENIKAVIEFLYANVKRAFINLVAPPSPTEMKKGTMFSSHCSLLHMVICPCLIMNLAMGSLKQKMFGVSLQQILAENGYYNREDFTVVLQPFLYNAVVPKNYADYISMDCTHPNLRGQGVLAFHLWNNMLEPLGAKTDKIDFDTVYFKCPTKGFPYFYTSLNSENFSSSILTK